MLIIFCLFTFTLFVIPCGRLSWLSVSFSLHVKYTVSYRIVSYRNKEKYSTNTQNTKIAKNNTSKLALVKNNMQNTKTKPKPKHTVTFKNCSYVCAYHCVQWAYALQHRTILIIFHHIDL